MIDLNKGQIFYFPEFSKKHRYLLIYVAMCLMRRLLPYLIDKLDSGKILTTDFNKSCVFDMISNFTADFLTGIYKLVKFIKKKTKRKKENLMDKEHRVTDSLSSQKEKKLFLHKIEEASQMQKRFFIIMLVISISDIIAQLCLLIFSYIDIKGCTLSFSPDCETGKPKINEDDLIFTVALNILFRYIFSRLLLTIYIYYHHLVSMIITIISFIPLVIFNIITLKQKEITLELIIYIILNIAMTIIYAFEDVMNKIALSKLVIRPPELMFYKALFQIPLFTIVFLSVFLKDELDGNPMTFLEYVKSNSKNWLGRIFCRFSFIIANIFRTMSLMWVTEILSPNHLSILKSFEFVVLTLFSLAKDSISNNVGNDTRFYILELICCIFLLFASLIYNEFFVINRCNLMKSTDYIKSLDENTVDDEIEDIELMRKMDEIKNNESENENEGILYPNSSFTNSYESGNEKKS